MSIPLTAGVLAGSAAGSLVFSTLTYSLRELSRVRLTEGLERRGMARWLDPTMDRQADLVFVTAVWRLLFNTSTLLLSLELAEAMLSEDRPLAYVLAVGIGTLVTLVSSVMLPNALARHAGDSLVAAVIRPLHTLRWAMWPVTWFMHLLDRLVLRAVHSAAFPDPQKAEKLGQELQQELLSVVEEGEKEGVVDEEEREMIESVISFRDTTAGQIMTPRPEVIAIEATVTLAGIKRVIEESGLSRIPVYEDTLDHIVGVLYARDLLRHLGLPADSFNIRTALRPAFYVPETKPLRDLLHDFRAQKVHLAIVLDEYGGTSGLVTIEDVLEELVGDISDEHEPSEPAMFRRVDDVTIEADARTYVHDLNREAGLELPEDAGYDTLGGFVSTTAGRIPPKGETITYHGVRFTVLEAEPQRVTRVRIDLAPPDDPEAAGADKPAAAANGAAAAEAEAVAGRTQG
ncbi:MAG TPA: hemolysin family protein [Humisphaera sp.]